MTAFDKLSATYSTNKDVLRFSSVEITLPVLFAHALQVIYSFLLSANSWSPEISDSAQVFRKQQKRQQ